MARDKMSHAAESLSFKKKKIKSNIHGYRYIIWLSTDACLVLRQFFRKF